jgi:hypothetical protein
VSAKRPQPVIFDAPCPEIERVPKSGLRAWLEWKLGIGWKHWRTYRQAARIEGGFRVTETQCWHNARTGEVRQTARIRFTPAVQSGHRNTAGQWMP